MRLDVEADVPSLHIFFSFSYEAAYITHLPCSSCSPILPTLAPCRLLRLYIKLYCHVVIGVDNTHRIGQNLFVSGLIDRCRPCPIGNFYHTRTAHLP